MGVLLPKSKGLRCECGCTRLKVIWTRKAAEGIKRSRVCVQCQVKTRTIEVAVKERIA